MKKKNDRIEKTTEQEAETMSTLEVLAVKAEEYFLQQHQAKFQNGNRETRQTVVEMLLAMAQDGFGSKLCVGVATNLLPQANEEEQAVLYRVIGIAWDGQGEFEKGLNAYLAALTLHRKTAGAVSPEVAAGLNYLAWHFDRKGDDVQAMRYIEESLQVQKSLWGPDEGPGAAINYLLKGLIHKKMGDLDAAKASLERALDLALRVEGMPHAALHEIEWELGMLSFEKGDFRAASLFFRKSLDLKIRQWGRKNQNLTPYLVTLGIAYGEERQHTKAITCLQQATALYREQEMEIDRLLFDALTFLGWNHRQLGHLKEAIASFQEAREIWSAIGDITPDEAARVYCELGLGLLDDGRFEEARKIVREGQRNVTKIVARNPEHPQEEGGFMASLTAFVDRIGPALKKEESRLRKDLAAVGDTKTVIRDHDGELLVVLADSPGDEARSLLSFSIRSFVVEGRDSQETSLSQGDLQKLAQRSEKKAFTWSVTERDLRIKATGDCWMLEWKPIYAETSPLRLQLDPKETAHLKGALGVSHQTSTLPSGSS